MPGDAAQSLGQAGLGALGLARGWGSREQEILLLLGRARSTSLLLSPRGDSTVSPQLALLYEEVLYTILHRLGKPEQQHVGDSQELYSYVQKVCPSSPNPVPKPCPLVRPSSQLQEEVSYAPSLLSKFLKEF